MSWLNRRRRWFVQGRTGNYEVKRNPGDPPRWECTCPGYLFRGRCRHMTEVRQQLIERYREVLG
jgi:hypothetical protein